jgi:hypothetical protein
MKASRSVHNVEILHDGCTKNVVVNAPAVLEDYASEINEEDECQTDFSVGRLCLGDKRGG